MLLLRRFLVLFALMFWQGGFVFYASVVVPIGAETFDSYYHSDDFTGRRQQGRVTQRVTYWLNVAGAFALLPLGWDSIATRDPKRRRTRRRGVLCLIIAILLGVLLWLYNGMSSLFNADTLVVSDEPLFGRYHRAYLWIAAAQWLCCLFYLLVSLRAWRAADRNVSVAYKPDAPAKDNVSGTQA